MNFIHTPKPYKGEHEVCPCRKCQNPTTCKKEGKFLCSVCQFYLTKKKT